MKKFCLLLLIVCVAPWGRSQDETEMRMLLSDLALEKVDDTDVALDQLIEYGDPYIKGFVESWRTGEVFSFEREEGDPVVLRKESEAYVDLVTQDQVSLTPEEEEELDKLRPSRRLRRNLIRVTDTIDLAAKNPSVRQDAALKLGLGQDEEYLPILRARLEKETHVGTRKVFEEAIALSLLENFETAEERIEAVETLGRVKSIRARDMIVSILNEATENGDQEMMAAAAKASSAIASREEFLKHAGSFFRGLSTGSVLLMVSFGLAITFGLMGIINMAHGEFIAIGGYTCYVVQNIFADWFGEQSAMYQFFFWFSIPISFVVAGGIGYGLEKGFFRFLYKRPLESLLATWGLSMVMRQSYRLIFGAANVQVSNPNLLSGNVEFGGLTMTYSRLFVILFAGFVCLITWALLNKTNLGLYIRAVMQNRNMASGLGIPVSRVNSLTFAFGCGLAAMAGAVLTQIGNVGPTMGQAYIVDSFMVVVVGGVGNLLGAGIAAMSIGVVDQFLQPILDPVMGKIIVFFIIILFLQWKPGGLFPTKSRSLDD